jgi:transcriptional regulator with XRE-family HTH domain
MSMEYLSTRAEGAPMKKMIQAAMLAAEMHPERVGERVTALRTCLGKSKAEFADSLGLDRSSLTKIEAGTKGLDIVVGARVADLYGFGLDFIYRGVLTDAPESLRSRILVEIHAAQAEKLMTRYPR